MSSLDPADPPPRPRRVFDPKRRHPVCFAVLTCSPPPSPKFAEAAVHSTATAVVDSRGRHRTTIAGVQPIAAHRRWDSPSRTWMPLPLRPFQVGLRSVPASDPNRYRAGALLLSATIPRTMSPTSLRSFSRHLSLCACVSSYVAATLSIPCTPHRRHLLSLPYRHSFVNTTAWPRDHLIMPPP